MRTRKLTVVIGVGMFFIVFMGILTPARGQGARIFDKKFGKGRNKTDKGKFQTFITEDRDLMRNNRAINHTSPKDGNLLNPKDHQTTMMSQNMTSIHHEKERPLKNITIGDGICHSIDIRNYIGHLEMLRPCRVIEGFLQIVLMEQVELSEPIKPFELLREITGYLLLYRVGSIKNIGHLFPNLAIIRGDKLLADYSLMVYEMSNVQELGLTKLTKITRGAVRLEKNPSLCFADTIDWSRIVVAGTNFIKNNANKASCPSCSGCPDGHCWSTSVCQSTEKPRCHPQCLAGCTGPTEYDCYVCKNFTLNGKCIAECPKHLYSHVSRRCITKEECLQIHEPQLTGEDDVKRRPFKGACITDCPQGYETATENNEATCRPCKGSCQKIRPGEIIRHISDAQRLKGSTMIKGSLEFQIRNSHPLVMQELEDAFGDVEEITGSLKVIHSFPITSLSFFKKLRIIRGEKLDLNNSSLVILDNPNLSSIFPPTQNVQILNGRLFFHYNPKLCYSNITSFAKRVGITDITEMEVQPDSNGDKVACDTTNIHLTVKSRGPTSAALEWTVYTPTKDQVLLSYLLNYIEANNETQNITYENNACGHNKWHIMDVEIPNSPPGGLVTQQIIDLKPYTRYAVYVKTLSARSRNNANGLTGQSPILFFRTEADVPSPPTAVSSTPESESTLNITWEAPEQPNGPIGYYIIAGFLRFHDIEQLSTRNYCTRGLEPGQGFETIHEVKIKPPPMQTDCCTNELPLKEESFQIYCAANTTISWIPQERKNYCTFHRYDNGESYFLSLTGRSSSSTLSQRDRNIIEAGRDLLDDRRTRIYNNTYYSFVFNVTADSNSYLIKDLRHFSSYTISLAACGVTLSNGSHLCSTVEYTNATTLKREHADDVENVRVQVVNNSIVIISWNPPRSPNGLTVAYYVDYGNLDVKDATRISNCIPAHLFRGEEIVGNLSPGRYRARVRTRSLSGDGAWSREVDFEIGLEVDNTTTIVLVIIIGGFLVILVVGILLWRSSQRRKQQERLIASVNPDYIESKYVRDSWEVPRENLELLEELGLGNFGMVYRGTLNGITPVAIKTIPDNCTDKDKNEFLNEASVMKNFSTYHIIKLLGVVSDGVPPYVIMELMENGDLKTYLRRIRDTAFVPDTSRIIRMASEIADGMAYLESKKFIHRDLAARNCMVSKDLVCKIGDFGMARDIYETDYYKIGQKGLLPIRWMAPENLSDGVFTSDSDVWSFGIVLWEILTLGELPYQGFSNDEVLHHVLRKGTVNIPRNVPEIVLKLMEKCLKWRPIERPTFMEIVAELEPFVGQDFCEKSFYHSEEGIEVRSAGLKKAYHHPAQIRFHWGNETARWVREFEDNVTLLDQTKAGTSRGRIFKNGFQHFGNLPIMEDVPLDR
ncbi:insulin-like receptor [Fopius arisanus]|uniref:receptor protein-tyrosine kinase n=1 Tax=Fopius arisanus TaxID=64838 RepID=A0A0C9RT38_9HYME|nr:PREDICTED: insulin-like receptor [Fopius arisanus]XP_011310957.1 PREDICTED: insulin-like receptor [Fopius arisanus]XP_011310958.1 PREDICTED: insulin-like receptor [Fopius arisanus]